MILKLLKKSIYPLILVGLLAGFVFLVAKLETKTTKQEVKLTDFSKTESERDSLKKVNESLDSMIFQQLDTIAKYASISETYSNQAASLKQSNAALKIRLERLLKDTTGTCGQRLETSLFLNDSLQMEVNALDSANYSLDKECQSYSDALYISTLKNDTQEKIIRSLNTDFNTAKVERDSLNAKLGKITKKLDIKFWKRNWLWSTGQFRRYVIK